MQREGGRGKERKRGSMFETEAEKVTRKDESIQNKRKREEKKYITYGREEENNIF